MYFEGVLALVYGCLVVQHMLMLVAVDMLSLVFVDDKFSLMVLLVVAHRSRLVTRIVEGCKTVIACLHVRPLPVT